MARIIITCLNVVDRSPIQLKIKVRPQTTIGRLKIKIEQCMATDSYCLMKEFRRWGVEAPPYGSEPTFIEITDADHEKTVVAMGFCDESLVLLEGALYDSNQLRARERLENQKHAKLQSDKYLARYPSEPLKALWEYLRSPNYAGPAIAMQIASDSRCGLERYILVFGGTRGFLRSRVPYFLLAEVTPLMLAIMAHRLDFAKCLLEAGVDINRQPKLEGFSYLPLDVAIFMKDFEAIELLSTAGAISFPIDKPEAHILLHQAVHSGKISSAEYFIAKGLDVNDLSRMGVTALHTSTRHSDGVMTSMLIDRGASVDAKDVFDCTPLHAAVIEYGYLKVIRILLAKGADVNAVSQKGTPLHVAVQKGYHMGPIKLLIASGAKVDAVNIFRETPLMSYCKDHIGPDWIQGAVVRQLIVSGADVMTRDKQGNTPLHIFSLRCGIDVAGVLLEYGADVEATNHEGNTPLHCCAESCSDIFIYSYAKFLVYAGADIRAKNLKNKIPFDMLPQRTYSPPDPRLIALLTPSDH